jgi:hypothetical protein
LTGKTRHLRKRPVKSWRRSSTRARVSLQKLLVRATEMFGVSGDRFVSQCD